MDIESEKLKPCPCCRGEPMFADLNVGHGPQAVTMWQVSCTGCGLSTAMDEDKDYAVQLWNQRLEYDSVKMWVTLLAGALPAAVIISLLLGSLMGISLAD